MDVDFLASGWRCRWGDGCVGILDEPAAELGQGCCSVGAELLDEDEAMTVVALAATLHPARFAQSAAAAAGGVLAPDAEPRRTRIVDGACIFLNPVGFAGGTGCALHLAALDDGDDPMDAKPSVCWQLPVRVERDPDGTSTLRRWRRDDWGPGGATMAWCCTEHHGPDGVDAYDSSVPVVVSLRREVQALVGPEVADELARRVSARRAARPPAAD